MHNWLLYHQQILAGLVTTLKIASLAVCFGMVMAVILALLEKQPVIAIQKVIKAFSFLMRALPELLVIFFLYFGSSMLLSALFGTYIEVNPFISGVFALSIIFAAYAEQVLIAAFDAIPKAQVQTARLLGLSNTQILWQIILPQCFMHAKPGLLNLWLVLLKDTALVSLIGVSDLMQQTQTEASATKQPFTFYLITAFIYLALSTVSEQFTRYMTQEKHKRLTA